MILYIVLTRPNPLRKKDPHNKKKGKQAKNNERAPQQRRHLKEKKECHKGTYTRSPKQATTKLAPSKPTALSPLPQSSIFTIQEPNPRRHIMITLATSKAR